LLSPNLHFLQRPKQDAHKFKISGIAQINTQVHNNSPIYYDTVKVGTQADFYIRNVNPPHQCQLLHDGEGLWNPQGKT
jgi:hypothetical protein